MSADDLNRRRFVAGATGSALLLATGLPAWSATDATVGITLFDPRFPGARNLAARLGEGALRAIHGDPTELAVRLAARPRAQRLRIRGVTTEAVPFCLAALITGATLTQHRIDRDLFSWTLAR